MLIRPALKPVVRIVVILCVLYLVILTFIYFWQRALLFFPTHATPRTGLNPWSDGGRIIGYCREVTNARTVWLMMHGNAGQAGDRGYALQCMSGQDSLYVLEYPGYGHREGSPSRESMNQAAVEGYRLLRTQNPHTPVCVLGESIGSGPACALAQEQPAPDKIVLVVPFDTLAKVASRQFFFVPVRLLLRDSWDNVEALRHYAGPVDIFAAEGDTIIPIRHARALARQIPTARFISISGGHNDWSVSDQVRIER
jgi:pimeloyl-ACP methyl ester carboxylesterase